MSKLPWLPPVCAILLALAPAASAGTICGVVRDASSSAPVPRAGVFAYQGGTYAGYLAVTDAAGAYCIEDIPAGTYDLAVRVDDYQIAWVTGVEVAVATNVDILSSAPARLDPPWPNPSSSGVFLRYRLGRAAGVRLEIFDLRGRRVRGWSGAGQPSDAALFWDFHDRDGRAVASGSYIVRLTVEGQILTRTLQKLQ